MLKMRRDKQSTRGRRATIILTFAMTLMVGMLVGCTSQQQPQDSDPQDRLPSGGGSTQAEGATGAPQDLPVGAEYAHLQAPDHVIGVEELVGTWSPDAGSDRPHYLDFWLIGDILWYEYYVEAGYQYDDGPVVLEGERGYCECLATGGTTAYMSFNLHDIARGVIYDLEDGTPFYRQPGPPSFSIGHGAYAETEYGNAGKRFGARSDTAQSDHDGQDGTESRNAAAGPQDALGQSAGSQVENPQHGNAWQDMSPQIDGAESACAYLSAWLASSNQEMPTYVEYDHYSDHGYVIHGYNITNGHMGTLFWYAVDASGNIYDEVLGQYVVTDPGQVAVGDNQPTAPSDCTYAAPFYTVTVPDSWSGSVDWRFDETTYSFEGLTTMGYELRVSNRATGEWFCVTSGSPQVILQGDISQAFVGSASYLGQTWQIATYTDAHGVGADSLSAYSTWVTPTK